jgi:hypothetical protein
VEIGERRSRLHDQVGDGADNFGLLGGRGLVPRSLGRDSATGKGTHARRLIYTRILDVTGIDHHAGERDDPADGYHLVIP